MQRIIFTIAPVVLLVVTGCTDAMYQQQYAVQQPPTLTQMQGQCFSIFKQFAAQTNCIRNAVITSGYAQDSHIQEYMLLMESLREKVGSKILTESDARLNLAGKLNEIKGFQQNEDAVQEQLSNQRAAQSTEMLKQIKPIQLEVYQPRQLPTSTIRTNCQAYGGQVNCISQ